MNTYIIELTQTIDYYKTIEVKASNEENARKEIDKMDLDLTNSNDFSSELEIMEVIKK